MRELLRRLHYLFNRRRFDRELAEEMAFHREMAEGREGGAPFGNALRLREDAREAWGWMWIDRSSQDLRYAARTLLHAPGFTVAAILTLAIGIGANVAAFGFFNLVVLRPLPVRDPDTLLRFERLGPQRFWSDLPYPAMAFYREHAKTLSAVLALNAAKVTIEGEDRLLTGHYVTANFFSELGATARLGRLLDLEDEAGGAEPVVVLGHGFWQRHFGADPRVVGQAIHLNGRAATVIGVAPPEFSGLGTDSPGLWLPLTQHPYFVPGSQLLTDFSAGVSSGVFMWGRLQPSLTPRMAEDELASLAAELRLQHPQDIWENERLPSQPGGYAGSVGPTSRGSDPPESLRTRLNPIFALLGTLVLLILAVACGNLGALLLARGAAREREIAVRIAVGAGTGRLVRQLFTESLLLALSGSAAGLACGYIVLRSMLLWTGAPAWLDPTPDWRVVVFAVGVGFATTLFFGLTPALQIAQQRHRATRSRTFLIGAQVAASCVLLIVSGLLVRALGRATSLDPGFEYRQIVAVEPGLAVHGYSPARARAYLDTVASRLRALPGVESVALTSTPPLGRSKIVTTLGNEGRALDLYIHQVDPCFLATMKIPLLRGHDLTRGDPQAVVVSESLARREWPGEDALGKPFALGEDSGGGRQDFTVVGISGNARSLALKDPDAVELYRLAGESDLPGITVLARTSGSPEALAASVGAVARAIDPGVVPQVDLLKSSFRLAIRDVERSALAVSALGLIALIVACLGIVGLVAYAVSQRTREIGIRMALGASSAHVLSIVLRQFERTIGGGLLIGVVAGAALSQILRRELYGLSTLDPLSYLTALVVFVVAAALAALWPARRALRVAPMLALRCD